MLTRALSTRVTGKVIDLRPLEVTRAVEERGVHEEPGRHVA